MTSEIIHILLKFTYRQVGDTDSPGEFTGSKDEHISVIFIQEITVCILSTFLVL